MLPVSLYCCDLMKYLYTIYPLTLDNKIMNNNNNNNNICLKSNIQTSSVDCAPRELTHACSRSDTCSRSGTEACDMCYVFNVNFDGFF